RFVFEGKTTCGLCHLYESRPGGKAPAPIRPVNVPPVWYTHGRFSHQAHRALGWLECHEGAEKSTKNTDGLLPGVKNCQTCHAGAATRGGGKQGGVRHDCVTCHRYHNGDSPEAGLGAAARGAKARRTVREFLDGKFPSDE